MKVSEIEVTTARNVEDCLTFLASTEEKVRLIAGGTDAVVRMKEGAWRPQKWVNIKHMKELRYIVEDDEGIHIGPLTTHSDIVKSSLLQEKADVLVQASWEVGAEQIRNMGTIGGNLGTASPAGDTIPALFVLDASVKLSSVQGSRKVDIEQFFIAPGKTVQKESEMITDIIIRPQDPNEIGIFEKLGPRKAQSIAIVNVAMNVRMNGQGRLCSGGKIAYGSVAPTIIRAQKCESMLNLAPLDNEMIANIAKVAWKEVAPISDIRATAEYRRDMASALLERGLYRLMQRWDNNE